MSSQLRPGQHNVYIAGPYSATNPAEEWANVMSANRIGYEVMRLGHRAFVPHAATCFWHAFGGSGPDLGYEDYMDLDFSIIRSWATCLLYYLPSPGASRELDLANQLGLVVIYSPNSLPNLRQPIIPIGG